MGAAEGDQVGDPELLLAGTPYLIGEGAASQDRFSRVATRAQGTRERALEAAAQIAERAAGVLPQFETAIRSDLVAESNRMEGIESSPREIRQLAQVRAELLESEVSSFLRYVRDDPRLLSSLGLFRAYAVADEWANSQTRPREFEVRQLHELVMPGLRSAGAYKTKLNEIDGSEHTTTEPWRVAQEMSELVQWFEGGSGDAALDAAVVHAWLTHIHPFEDGNGRMARLLANLVLLQRRYPPLLLRSGADRGQYLDALHASDEGDILPLYDVFVKSLRRVVLSMEKPNYVESKVRDELLGTVNQRHATWRGLARIFFTCLEQKCRFNDWTVRLMGYPTLEDFDQLMERQADGNCWFAKLRHRGTDEWLLWFGYRSDELTDLAGQQRAWPSIFFAQHTEDPRAVHPFESRFAAHEPSRRPAEISLVPGVQSPATVRWDLDAGDLQIDEAAGLVIRAICR